MTAILGPSLSIWDDGEITFFFCADGNITGNTVVGLYLDDADITLPSLLYQLHIDIMISSASRYCGAAKGLIWRRICRRTIDSSPRARAR